MSAPQNTCDTSENPTVKTIILGGELGRRFGRKHYYACNTPAEAIRALCVLVDGLENFLLNSILKYKVFLNRRGVRDVEKELVMNHAAEEYAVMPVLTGAKNAGLTQIVIGALLIAATFVLPGMGIALYQGLTLGAALAATGVSMMIGGAITMLMGSRKPNVSQGESPESKPSYYVNGPVNTSAQGQCIPVGYGEFLGGSAVASVSITTVDIPV